jgi:hypothetical protein
VRGWILLVGYFWAMRRQCLWKKDDAPQRCINDLRLAVARYV